MPKTKHQRDKERWLREFRADVHKRLKFKPNPKEMKQACDIALKWARKGKSPSEMAEKACAGKLTNPPKKWHKKQARKYKKRLAADTREGHDAADYWQGAASAETAALAWRGNAPKKYHWGKWLDYMKERDEAETRGDSPAQLKAEGMMQAAADSLAYRRNPDNVRPWYWECEECGFITPRSPRSKARDLGPCCRCGSTAWRKGTRAKSPGGGRPEMRRNPKVKGYGQVSKRWKAGYDAARKDARRGISPKRETSWGDKGYAGGYTVGYTEERQRQWGKVMRGAGYRFNPQRKKPASLFQPEGLITYDEMGNWYVVQSDTEIPQDQLFDLAKSGDSRVFGPFARDTEAKAFLYEDHKEPSRYRRNPLMMIMENPGPRMRRNYPAPRILTDVATENYFDVADGLYWFCMEWHSGGGSRLYAVGSNLGFRPAPSARGPEGETAREVYDELNQMAETNYRDAEDEAERLARAVKRSYVMTSNPRRRGARRPRVRRRR